MLRSSRKYFLLFITILASAACCAQTSQQLLDKGWQELIRDNDTTALQLFGQAYIEATKGDVTEQRALSLLYMGFCSYGYSYSKGLSFCSRSMEEYKKLEKSAPAKALEGRSRCLQLMATIKARQGSYRESLELSRQAMQGFSKGGDTTGTLGLIYNSLGSAYKQLKKADSSEYYHRLALEEHLLAKNVSYISMSYIKLGDIERAKNNKVNSFVLYTRAKEVADSTANRQAQASASLALGEWHETFPGSYRTAEYLFYLQAENIASTLTDKSFSLRAAQHLLDYYKRRNDYPNALSYQEKVTTIRDSIYSWDRVKELKTLEIQFDVAEKDRQLTLVKNEKEITTLTNYFLWSGIVVVIVLAGGIIIVLRRINKRDKQLLQTKEALVVALEEQKLLKEKQMQQEIEFKESQLSALTLQMVQKSELLQELKEKLETDKALAHDQALNKIINKGLNQDKDWSDFNASFESLNKNFYARLKEAYPEISPNDLRVCALIKLNLSIKEMAGILNISPDSVKTARYRLRKKLQLNTEDNLAEFIASL